VISAVGEAFNNIALHGYLDLPPGRVEIEVAASPAELSIELRDYGRCFDLGAVQAPDLGHMHESGMGVFIIKSFMDRVEYTPGPPNVLRLTKRVAGTNG
jgi:serine/threonine-protein kinase RsbW